MKNFTKFVVAIIAIYALGIIANEHIIRNAPKIARFFVPPFFDYSRSVSAGIVRPFRIGMKAEDVKRSASDAGLLEDRCDPQVKFTNLGAAAFACYKYAITGTYWDIWVVDGIVVGIHVFTSQNVSSD